MKKKSLICLISVLCLIVAIFTFNRVKADSGWDSSYDSGGGFSSGWGYDYGSSWSHDYGSSSRYRSSGGSYSGSNSNSSSSPLDVVFFFIIMFIIFYGVIDSSVIKYYDVDEQLLKKYGINKEKFKKMVYEKYVCIQEAWMNFDYDKLKDNLTNELYNSYMMQLDALKLKKQKNIMSDFKLIDIKIIDISSANDLVNVRTYLRVRMYDYVVDEDNNVVRGTKSKKIDIEYIIDFVKAVDTIKNMKCPNCGAKIEAVTSGTCKYCKTKIVVPAKEYVMSRKTSIGQRRK